jgi:hypothetical protein
MSLLLKLRQLPLHFMLIFCSSSAFILDILSSLYFIRYWRVQMISEKMIAISLAYQGYHFSDFDRQFQVELMGIVEQTAAFVLLAFLIVNSFFYLYLYFQKRWAWQYALTYTATASLFCLVTAFEAPAVGVLLSSYNILAIFLYALLALGIWSRKDEIKGHGFKFKKQARQNSLHPHSPIEG